MKRPEHLPDFAEPPLEEVVLGVQFAPVPSYSSVHAYGIWDLFRDSFPVVREQPLLEPQFETFGGANPQPSFQFHVGPPPVGSRLWFISEDESHLLQFQADRFLTNWRKQQKSRPYPRYEGISGAFEESLNVLSEHFSREFDCRLDINQAEIAYINIIPVEDFSHAGSWFSLWSGEICDVEALTASFNEVIRDANGKPYARLLHELQSVYTVDGKKKAFRLSLTFRGKPAGIDVEAAMKFYAVGRDVIVTRFGEMTTSQAHKSWGRLT